jgi:Protein of unknown function (DUF2721)
MLTPALFMTANGSLIISTSNRMSRIVDRIRVLNDLADKTDRGSTDFDFLDLRRAHYVSQLGDLGWRSDRVRLALTMLYLALSSFVGTSLVLALDVLLGSRIGGLPTLLAVVGVGLMLTASVNLTFEAHRALKSNRHEIGFHRDLQARRHAEREKSIKT